MSVLWLQLRKLRRAASPSREFKAALWRQLAPAPAVGLRLPRMFAVGIASIVLLFGMGTGVYAYGSPDVTEGHPLYSVKQGIENVEGRLAFSEEQKLRHQRKMVRRRIIEALRHADSPEQVERILWRVPPEKRERIIEFINLRRQQLQSPQSP